LLAKLNELLPLADYPLEVQLLIHGREGTAMEQIFATTFSAIGTENIFKSYR